MANLNINTNPRPGNQGRPQPNGRPGSNTGISGNIGGGNLELGKSPSSSNSVKEPNKGSQSGGQVSGGQSSLPSRPVEPTPDPRSLEKQREAIESQTKKTSDRLKGLVSKTQSPSVTAKKDASQTKDSVETTSASFKTESDAKSTSSSSASKTSTKPSLESNNLKRQAQQVSEKETRPSRKRPARPSDMRKVSARETEVQSEQTGSDGRVGSGLEADAPQVPERTMEKIDSVKRKTPPVRVRRPRKTNSQNGKVLMDAGTATPSAEAAPAPAAENRNISTEPAGSAAVNLRPKEDRRDESDDGPRREWEPSIPENPANLYEYRETRNGAKRDRSISRIAAWIKDGYFRIYSDSTGTSRSPLLQKEMDDFKRFVDMDLDGTTDHFVMEAVMHQLGLTPDTKDRLFLKEESSKVFVNERVVVKALRQMRFNIEHYGVPFVHDETTSRFCIPVIRRELAEALTNESSKNNIGVDADGLMKFGIDEYIDKVRPALADFARQGEDQRKAKMVLDDMVDAVERLNGTTLDLTGRIGDTDFTIDEAFDEMNQFANLYGYDATVRANESMRSYSQKVVEAAKKEDGKFVRDKNGNFVRVQDVTQHPASWIVDRLISFMKGTALVFNPVLGVYSSAEHVLGNLTNMMANRMMRAWYSGKYGREFANITDMTRQVALTDRVHDVVDDALRAYASGGRVAFDAYLAKGGKLGGGSGTDTMQKLKSSMSKVERAKYAVENGLNKYEALGGKIASGGFLTNNMDTLRFIEQLYLEMQKSSDVPITPERFENLLDENPQQFLTEMLKRPEGKNALMFALDTTAGGNNIYTEFVQREFAKHKLTKFAVYMFVSKFPEYGINIVGRLLPMTHTFNYLVTMGVAKHTKNTNLNQGAILGGVRIDVDRQGSYMSDPEFRDGLMQNIIMDAAWLGTRSGMILLINGVMSLVGVEPPDDEDKRNIWGEWKIGGVAVKENWVLRDVLGLTAPVALLPLAVAQGADPWKLLVSAAEETLSGNTFTKVGALAGSIVNFDRDLMASMNEVDEEYGDDAPSDMEKMKIKGLTYGLSILSNMFEPPILRQIYEEASFMSTDNLAVSSSMIYTPDPNDDPDATIRTSYEDAQIRNLTKRYPTLGFFMDLANGLNAQNDGRQKTSYMRGGMPLVEISDPVQAYWIDRFHIDEDMSPEDRAAVRNDAINIIEQYDDPYRMAADGIVLPYEVRQMVGNYYYEQIDLIDLTRAKDYATPGVYTQNGKSYEENKLARDQRYESDQKMKSELYDKIDMLWSGAIPYSSTKYNQWETTWTPIYTWKDSGEPATVLDWFFNQDQVDKEYYAYGDHKSSLSPVQTVDDRYGTYDFQTPLAWANENTDMDRLRELYGDAEVAYGPNQGESIIDVITGEGNSEVPLTGQRALVPVDEYYQGKKMIDPEESVALGEFPSELTELRNELEKYRDAEIPTNSTSDWGSGWGGGWYYSGGGGGGGSYSPDIYSHAPYSLSSDKPATMYSKTPYESRFDYLYPGFETKGSREAYKRQDL